RFQSMEEFGVALGDPEAFAKSPEEVAHLGAVAAAPTAAVPVIEDTPSAKVPSQLSASDAATIVAAKKKPQTTLSGAASESAVRAPAGGGGRRVAIIGGAAVAIAAGVVVAIIKLGPGAATTPPVKPPVVTPAPAPAPTAAVVAPKPPAEVEVAIKSDPPGAQVVRTDGVIVGVTPVTMKLTKGAPALDVELTLEGYRAERRTIASDVNRELDVNLLKAPKHASRSAAAAKPTDAKPADGKPVEAKPAEKPAQAKPAETRPKPDKPGDPDKDLIPAQL
ncbi:MAG TPA: PEGA domain-containing protein, partial [Polyangia bacterium]